MGDLADWLRLRSEIESSEGLHAISQKLLDAAAEIERLAAIASERDMLRHDISVCREQVALLEATVRVYERQEARATCASATS